MSGPIGNSYTQGALTTVEAVKQFMGLQDEEPYIDQQLIMLINAVSDHIMSITNREFQSSLGTGPRNFECPVPFSGWAYVNFGRWQCQNGSVTELQIDTDTTNPGPTTITSDQYQFQPISNDWGVYTGVRFFTYAVGPPIRQGAEFPRQLTVTATWGWPSVPPGVEQAAILTTATWLRRDAQGYSSTFNAEEVTRQRPQAIPSAAWDLLAPYAKPPV